MRIRLFQIVIVIVGSINFYYSKAQSYSSSEIDSMIATADDLSKNENYPEALKIYNLLVGTHDKSSFGFHMRGLCYYKLEDWPKAVADFTTAIELVKENYCNYWVTGSRPMKIGNMTVIPIEGTNLENRYVDDFFYRGCCKLQLEDFTSAKKDFDTFLTCREEGAAYYYRAVCKLNLENNDFACSDLSRAGELGFEAAYDLIKEHCH